MKQKVILLVILLCVLVSPCAAVAQEAVGQAEMVGEHSGVVADILHWYDAHMNYWTAGALMVVESSLVPFPSEVVIPPAVYFALDENSSSNMLWWVVILVGTLGALIGAYINYFLALWLGRPIIYKFADSKVGRVLQLSKEKVERAEVYFNEHGAMSTFIGRFIPVIRQLISLPAGMARMNLWSFTLYTTLGAFVWNCVLALLGYLAHLAGDMSVIEKYSHELTIIIIALLLLVVLFFVVRYFIKKKRQKTA